MKLAEAMKEKSRLKKKIAGLKEELEQAVQVTDELGIKAKDLLLDLEESLRRMDRLSAAIYHTNDLVRDEGKTLTRLVCTRDALFFRLELYKKLLQLSGNAGNPSLSGLDIPGLQDRVQRTKEEIRTLSDRIQKASWTIDLID